MIIKININDYVKIKLTPYGETVLKEHLDSLNLKMPKYLEPNKKGYMYLQIWEIMNIFGSECYMGNQQIIEHNEIIFDEG